MKRMVSFGQEKMAAQVLRRLSEHTCTGVLHCLQFSSYNQQLILSEMSAAQALLLALYHSLLKEDLAHYSSLIAVSHILEHLESPSIKVWMRDDFNFPVDEVTKVIRTLAHIKEKGLVDVPDQITGVFVCLAKKYRVASKVCDLQDKIALHFLSNNGDTLTHDVGTMTNDLYPFLTDPKECSMSTNTVEPPPIYDQKKIVVYHDTAKEKQNFESDVNRKQYTNVVPGPSVVSAELNYTNQLTAFHQAAENGVYSKLNELLSRGVNPELKERRYGNTAAHWAIKKDRVDILYLLQRYGANLSERNQHGLTPLHMAAETGKTRTLKWLLDNWAGIDDMDDMYMTPLSKAASRGQLLAGRMLLDRGASIDHCDRNRRTPLFLAVLGGHHCMVRLFLERGADTSIRDRWSKTLLHAAIASGDLITFHFILKQNIDINAKDSNGRTAFHDALETANNWALTPLKEKGANLEIKHKIDQTPLHSGLETVKL